MFGMRFIFTKKWIIQRVNTQFFWKKHIIEYTVWNIILFNKYTYMLEPKKLMAIKDFLDSAQKSIISAKKILATMSDNAELKRELEYLDASGLSNYTSGSEKIIEGVFTGESMLGSDGAMYPVPQNYASKSKLVQWSKLKAIIHSDGKITYKIIEEIEHETKIGILTKNKDRFQVIAEGKTYNTLLAAVTFIKWEIGDSVSIRIPKGKDASYAAVEAIIPKMPSKE